MASQTIFFILLIAAYACAHEDNTETLNELAADLDDIKNSQQDYDFALDALATNLNKIVDEKIGTAEGKARQLDEYGRRLSELEENVKYIQGFVDDEQRMDEYLIELSTNQLKDVDERVTETKQLTNTAKEEVKVSLGSSEVTLKSVKSTAESRNFNLGGAIFYGGHGSACVPGADECQLAGGECRAGQCQCQPGLSYDRRSQTCIERCISYGWDFEVVPNMIIRGNNSAVYDGVSLQECKQRCLDAEEFECITFDYFNWYEACYLSEITALDEEENWEYNGAGSHFQRNCN